MKEVKVIDKRTEEAPEPQETSLVVMAMDRNLSPELIEKMMALQERNDANEARKAFFEAKAQFKLSAPSLKKDKYNKFFDSWYTSLGELLETYKDPLALQGLTLDFPQPTQTETSMTVICRLSHRLGHSETTSLMAPIDKAAVGKASGQRSRTPIQDIKTTFTYLRSATVEAILGVTGTDASVVDDDGNSAGVSYLTTDQVTEINDKIKELEIDEGKFLGYLSKALKSRIETVDDIPASGYKMAMASIKAKESKK